MAGSGGSGWNVAFSQGGYQIMNPQSGDGEMGTDMEIILGGIIILLFIGAGILSARLCCYRKQMRHMLCELDMIEKTDTKMLLTSAVSVGQTGEVISAVNRILQQKRQTEEQLYRENRSYRESITSISHDIRTPLTSAKGYLQMLAAENAMEEQRNRYARIVERRLDDLTGMLDWLFLYARIEAGELELQQEVINAGNLFAETVSMFYEDFVKKNCEPEVTVPSEPCHISADREAFVRILENLIKNALTHGTGGYELSLRQEKNEAVIRVSNRTDTIEMQDMEHIFERFYTTDTSRTRKNTGLGLAIVKRLTEQMQGKVEASLVNGYFSIEVRLKAE